MDLLRADVLDNNWGETNVDQQEEINRKLFI